MTLQAATNFIHRVREDEDLAERVKNLPDQLNLAPLCELAVEVGYTFTAEEFETAWVADWRMRRVMQTRLNAQDANK